MTPEITSGNFLHLCPACGNQEDLFAKPVDVCGTAYSVWYCRQCKFGETSPQPDNATLNKLHSTQYYRNGEGIRFVSPVEWLVEGMRRFRIFRLSRMMKTGRALDIGCGSGRFLRALRSACWDVAGLELNEETATSARTIHGLNVQTSLDVFSDQSFNLITITHVLEHIPDPQLMLMRCARLLQPGGVIAVAVPNINSWQAQLTRKNWFHLDVPRHLWHFSEVWLSRTLQHLGFEQVSVRRLDLAHNIYGWLQSLLNLMGLHHNRLYTFLSSDDLTTGTNPHYGSLIVSLALVPFLLPLSVTLAIAESISGASGTIEIVARITSNNGSHLLHQGA